MFSNKGLTIWNQNNGLSRHYGEMGNLYGSDAPEVLAAADKWYAMHNANINVGEVSGFTYVDGSAGAGNITTANGGASINIADAAHGLTDGDIVTVQSTNHNGVGTVLITGVTDNTNNFEVDIAFVGNEASAWQMGSYLLCAIANQYRGVWSGCFKQSLSNAQTAIIAPFKNTIQNLKATAEKYLTNTSDVAAPEGNGIVDFSIGDRLWFAIQSSGAQTITFKVRNVSLH